MRSPGLRRLVLTVHIASSVGWLGAAVVVFALAIAGMTAQDDETVRAVYLALDLAARLVLVPAAIISLLTGLLQAYVTRWGLFEHYWVLAKLLMNIFASIVLLLFLRVLGTLARIAAQPGWTSDDLAQLREPTVVVHGVGALFFLTAALALSVYKPKGMTGYGWRKRRRQAHIT